MANNTLYYNLNTLKNVQNSILQILRERGDIVVPDNANLGKVPALISGLSNQNHISVGSLTDIAKCGGLITRFAIFSDLHLVSPTVSASYNTANGYVNGLAAMYKYAEEKTNSKLDFVVFEGDTYDPYNGTDEQYIGISTILDEWRQILGNTPLYMIPGNHDFGSDTNWDAVAKMSNYSNLNFLEGTNKSCYYTTINGDLYIWFGIFNSKSFSYTDAQFTWLFNLLESNRDKTRIFLFSHFYDGTVDNFGWRYLNGNYINNGWTSSNPITKFGLIKNYKNVIWFTGHSHTNWNFEDTYPTIKVHSNNTARLVSVPSMRDNNQDLRVSVYSNMVVLEPFSANVKLTNRIYFIGNAETTPVYYVNYNLTGFTSSNTSPSVAENGSYSTILTLQQFYKNPGVSIYMGGVNITSTALINNSNGTYSVNIANVTGQIDITATATITYYSVVYTLSGYTTSSTNQVISEQPLNIVLTPINGYIPTPTSINMSIVGIGQIITNGVSNNSGVTIITDANNVTTIACTGEVIIGNISISAVAPEILDITYNLAAGFTVNNNVSTIISGSSYTTTITPPEGKTSNVIVTMGGVDITSSSLSGNVITINNVTGDIIINVKEIKTSYAVSYSLESGFILSNNAVEVSANVPYTTVITVPEGKTSNVVVTMNGADITSSSLSGNTISIASVTGDIVITITGTIITFAVSYNLASGVTLTNSASSINYGSAYSTIVTPPANYSATIIVTMNGVDITDSSVSGNTINISSVTGIISIQVTTTRTSYTVSYNIAAGFSLSNNTNLVNNGASYTSIITEPAEAIMGVVITMGGTDITSSSLTGDNINITSVTGDIIITITDNAAVYVDYVKAVYNVSSTTAATQLLYSTYAVSTYITNMVIDGVSVTPAVAHTFSTTGMHTVYMKMAENKTHSNMFKDCVDLYSCILPAVTAALSGYLFSGCTKLHDVYIRTNFNVQISTYVLYNCPALAIVKLGPTITGFAQYNFNSTCISLAQIYIYRPSGVFSYLGDANTNAGTIHYVSGVDISALTNKLTNFTLAADL